MNISLIKPSNIKSKFGLDIPSSPQHAYEINEETCTTFWTKAIEMEMYKIKLPHL